HEEVSPHLDPRPLHLVIPRDCHALDSQLLGFRPPGPCRRQAPLLDRLDQTGAAAQPHWPPGHPARPRPADALFPPPLRTPLHPPPRQIFHRHPAGSPHSPGWPLSALLALFDIHASRGGPYLLWLHDAHRPPRLLRLFHGHLEGGASYLIV